MSDDRANEINSRVARVFDAIGHDVTKGVPENTGRSNQMLAIAAASGVLLEEVADTLKAIDDKLGRLLMRP